MQDEKGIDWLNLKSFIVLCIAIGLVVGGGYIGYGVLSSSQEGTSGFVYAIKPGDSVTVDYIGMFQDGTVFDTSITEVAINNVLYPKSLSFEPRGAYPPLSFTVGEGQMITGFDIGVIGMVTNETKVLTIPPEYGYGFPDENLIQTMDMTVTVPVYEWTTNTTVFQETYFMPAELGTTIISEKYGWNATVHFIDPVNDLIRIKNEPHHHEVIGLFSGWDSEVISIDTSANNGVGEITLKHLLTSEDAGKIMSTDENGSPFLVTNVDPASNEITVDYNREVVGKTLVFTVTIVSIIPLSENPEP